ncbi:hypothetical protein MTO96_025839, partial [Rhipicephalus appendiculatus]
VCKTRSVASEISVPNAESGEWLRLSTFGSCHVGSWLLPGVGCLVLLCHEAIEFGLECADRTGQWVYLWNDFGNHCLCGSVYGCEKYRSEGVLES